MPYIKESAKSLVEPLSADAAHGPRELNYQLTRLLVHYIRLHKLNYQTINDIIGALEGAKLEFYRRIAVPYENAKLAENGDVYD